MNRLYDGFLLYKKQVFSMCRTTYRKSKKKKLCLKNDK